MLVGHVWCARATRNLDPFKHSHPKPVRPTLGQLCLNPWHHRFIPSGGSLVNNQFHQEPEGLSSIQ